MDLGDIEPALAGITETQLHPIVEALLGEPVAEFQIKMEHRLSEEWLRRWNGRRTYGTPSFLYTTCSGRRGMQSVFIKRSTQGMPHEGHHYEHLMQFDAPVPRMYGRLAGPKGEEILFLEYIDHFADQEVAFFADASNLRAFLSQTARFDAVPVRPEYAAMLDGCKIELAEQHLWKPALEKIWSDAAAGLLGDNLQRFLTPDRLKRIQSLADTTGHQISVMPKGLLRADHRLWNAGRRRGTGEILFYDLEGTTTGPRFDAVADFLGGPDCIRLYSSGPSNVFQPRGGLRDEWAEHYLVEYRHRGGGRATLENLLAETQALFVAHIFHDIKWWPASMFYWWRHEDDPEDVRQKKQDTLLRMFEYLLC